MRSSFGEALLLLSCILSMASCARYEPIPWRDAGGRHSSVEKAAEGLVDSLAASLKKSRLQRISEESGKNRPLRVIVAGFPEARSGARTSLSLRIERAMRRGLDGSDAFRAVDGGTGVAWQETFLAGEARPAERKSADLEMRRATAGELDADHPLQGLWPKARAGRYGEDSAMYAASMLGAEAFVYGAYALDESRVRVWASVALNAPARSGYYRRGLGDVFGEAARRRKSRPHLTYARGALLLRAVPREWLKKKAFARPRKKPAPRKSWGHPSFEAAMEWMDRDGSRTRLSGGEAIPSSAIVLGRLRARSPLYVYGFSIDESGKTSELLASAERRGEAAFLRPDAPAHFTMRLREESRSYRVYFVSRADPFSSDEALRAARARLGLSAKSKSASFTYEDVARGVPARAWTPPAGQDRLILGDGWAQEVFWFRALSTRAARF